MSLVRRQIYPIDVNFHIQKSLEIFDENSVAENLIQKVPCLMPIRIEWAGWTVCSIEDILFSRHALKTYHIGF